MEINWRLSVQMMEIYEKKYETIWTKLKDFKNIKLNAFPFYEGRYIKPKIRTYGDKVHANFRV